MLSFFRESLRVWAVWTLLATAVLYLNPVGRFGAVELLACLGPVVLAADLRIRRELAFLVGLPAITLMALLEAGPDSLFRLLLCWLVFAVGVWLMARMIDGRAELETIAGRVAFLPDGGDSMPRFLNALEREVGRARRHEKSFIVLSISADPNSLAQQEPQAPRHSLMGALAERRFQFELHGVLSEELHVYSDVACARQSVLALVPEVSADDVEPLLSRLRDSIEEKLGAAVQVGLSAFPEDAISAQDLVTAAERARRASNLRSLPDASTEPADLPGLASESKA